MRKLQKKNSGFTLVELIITLLIGSILLAWGVPNYRDLKARRMVTDISNEIVYSFTQARAEAVRYGNDVRVIPNGGSWQNGWRTVSIGVDGNPNVLLAQQGPIDPVVTIQQTGALAGNVTFNSIGGLDGGNAGRFELQHTHNTSATKAITINLSGSARVVN